MHQQTKVIASKANMDEKVPVASIATISCTNTFRGTGHNHEFVRKTYPFCTARTTYALHDKWHNIPRLQCNSNKSECHHATRHFVNGKGREANVHGPIVQWQRIRLT